MPLLPSRVNDLYEGTGQLVSLSKAAEQLDESTLIIFGDILLKKYILQFAIEDPADVVIIVDSKIDPESTVQSDYVTATEPDRQSYFAEESYVEQMEFTTPEKKHAGEFIGVMKLSPEAGRITHEFIQQLMDFKLIHVIEPDTSAASGRQGRFEAYTLDFAAFMEPRKRNIEHVEFWKIDDQRRRQGLREAPVYPLSRVGTDANPTEEE